MREGRGCPMCEAGGPDESPYGIRFFAGVCSDAYLQKAGIQRGYSIVIWRGRHVAEPYQLSDQELTAYVSELTRVSRAIERHFEPVKMNYNILGNSVPHLHTHVIPRYALDPKPLHPFPFPREDPPEFDEPELKADVEALKQLLA
jgi:diadenosine tetraphosphate (Ap4A) HIT family hydrolase